MADLLTNIEALADRLEKLKTLLNTKLNIADQHYDDAANAGENTHTIATTVSVTVAASVSQQSAEEAKQSAEEAKQSAEEAKQSLQEGLNIATIVEPYAIRIIVNKLQNLFNNIYVQ